MEELMILGSELSGWMWMRGRINGRKGTRGMSD